MFSLDSTVPYLLRDAIAGNAKRRSQPQLLAHAHMYNASAVPRVNGTITLCRTGEELI